MMGGSAANAGAMVDSAKTALAIELVIFLCAAGHKKIPLNDETA
jgi:hypothetical protein